MSQHWILKGRKLLPVPLMVWAMWLERSNRTVARTIIGESKITTSFIGLNLRHNSGPPLLFETVVFGGKYDQEQRRCTTYEQAEQQHEEVCKGVRNG